MLAVVRSFRIVLRRPLLHLPSSGVHDIATFEGRWLGRRSMWPATRNLRSVTVSASFLEPVLSRTSSFIIWSPICDVQDLAQASLMENVQLLCNLCAGGNAGAVNYLHFIRRRRAGRVYKTLGLSRTASKINDDSTRNSQNFPTPVYFAPLLKGFPLELGTGARTQKY